jgi:hypothetical protein
MQMCLLPFSSTMNYLQNHEWRQCFHRLISPKISTKPCSIARFSHSHCETCCTETLQNKLAVFKFSQRKLLTITFWELLIMFLIDFSTVSSFHFGFGVSWGQISHDVWQYFWVNDNENSVNVRSVKRIWVVYYLQVPGHEALIVAFETLK